jgi:cation diffusion facilitator CzcD-associated flavoprotein CzcO
MRALERGRGFAAPIVMADRLPLVVIVGGGFAGLAAAKALRHAPVQVLFAASERNARLARVDVHSPKLDERLAESALPSVLNERASATPRIDKASRIKWSG